MRDIIGLEMVFCNEHTLIMYPKTVFNRAGPTLEVDTSSDESSEDEVFRSRRKSRCFAYITGSRHDLNLSCFGNSIAQERRTDLCPAIPTSNAFNVTVPPSKFPKSSLLSRYMQERNHLLC